MIDKKLQVLCLFVFTIGTVINDIKCVTREDCRREIFRTSNVIVNLRDNEAYMLIMYVLDEFHYDGIIELLYPPDSLLLTGRDENDSIYNTIKENELAIQQKISEMTGLTPTNNFDGMTFYDDEVALRGEILNSTFRMVLNDKMKRIKMCVNGENYKCILVGLIKRTVEFRMKNEPKCNDNNDGTCTITPTEWILRTGVLVQPPTLQQELFRDHLRATRNPYYETMLFDQERGLITWYCDVPPFEEQDSDDE